MNEDFDRENQKDTSFVVHRGSGSPEIPKKKGMSAAGIVALALCCAILGGIAGSAGTLFFFRNGSAELPEEPGEAMEAVEAAEAAVQTSGS